jgi:Family of unknown function (DUF6492)
VEELLDAVLPLTAADAARAQILFRSLEAFFEPLATCYVVAPARDVQEVRAHVPHGPYVVMSESEVVPEIGYFWTTARLRAKLRLVGPPIHGWFVQQLVKLAIAERVKTSFYLTLDADVICLRPTRYDHLVRGDRALVQTAPPNHPEWNDDAERVLGVPRSGRQYGVTPALLARDAVAALVRHVEQRVDRRIANVSALLPRRARHVAGSWRSFLLRQLPWTEYALYHTFLEHAGLFDTYHLRGGEYAIYGNSVWLQSQFDEWDPAEPFGTNEFRFSVVQSATRIPPERVWERFEPHLARGGDPQPHADTAGDGLPARDERLRRIRDTHDHTHPLCMVCALLGEVERLRARLGGEAGAAAIEVPVSQSS